MIPSRAVDPINAISVLSSWQSVVVALVGAFLWALPIEGRWRLWHHSVGLALVALVAMISALRRGELDALVPGAIQGMTGLGISWILIEAVVHAQALHDKLRSRPPALPQARALSLRDRE